MNDFQITKQRMIAKIKQTRQKVKEVSFNMEVNRQNKQKASNQPPQIQSNFFINNKMQQGQFSKNQRKLLAKLQKELNDNQDRLKELQSFPFGKQRTKMVQIISQQMNPRQDEYNKIMLNKFRVDAIQYRNNRKRNSFNTKNVYLSESMMPTLNYKILNIPNPNPQIINHSIQYPSQYASSYFPKNPNVSRANERLNTLPQKLQHQQLPNVNTQNIGVNTSFIFDNQNIKKELSLKKKKKQQKYKQLIKSQLRYEKLSQMIKDMNYQLKKNTQLLNQSVSNHFQKSNYINNLQQSQYSVKKNYNYQSIIPKTQSHEQNLISLPTVIYANKDNRSKTIDVSDIKKHLVLLKRDKKRLQICE